MRESTALFAIHAARYVLLSTLGVLTPWEVADVHRIQIGKVCSPGGSCDSGETLCNGG